MTKTTAEQIQDIGQATKDIGKSAMGCGCAILIMIPGLIVLLVLIASMADK